MDHSTSWTPCPAQKHHSNSILMAFQEQQDNELEATNHRITDVASVTDLAPSAVLSLDSEAEQSSNNNNNSQHAHVSDQLQGQNEPVAEEPSSLKTKELREVRPKMEKRKAQSYRRTRDVVWKAATVEDVDDSDDQEKRQSKYKSRDTTAEAGPSQSRKSKGKQVARDNSWVPIPSVVDHTSRATGSAEQTSSVGNTDNNATSQNKLATAPGDLRDSSSKPMQERWDCSELQRLFFETYGKGTQANNRKKGEKARGPSDTTADHARQKRTGFQSQDQGPGLYARKFQRDTETEASVSDVTAPPAITVAGSTVDNLNVSSGGTPTDNTSANQVNSESHQAGTALPSTPIPVRGQPLPSIVADSPTTTSATTSPTITTPDSAASLENTQAVPARTQGQISECERASQPASTSFVPRSTASSSNAQPAPIEHPTGCVPASSQRQAKPVTGGGGGGGEPDAQRRTHHLTYPTYTLYTSAAAAQQGNSFIVVGAPVPDFRQQITWLLPSLHALPMLRPYNLLPGRGVLYPNLIGGGHGTYHTLNSIFAGGAYVGLSAHHYQVSSPVVTNNSYNMFYLAQSIAPRESGVVYML